MFFYFFLICLYMNSLMFFIMNHPLTIGLSLLSQTILISILISSLSKMAWFSYSLFLIFVGGMLILFMYMTSLASNEIFMLKFNKMKILLFMLLATTLIVLITSMDFKNNLNNNIMNNETMSLYYKYLLNTETLLMLNKMYNFPMNMITILMVVYLLMTLIMTVKITNIFKGPLRQKI